MKICGRLYPRAVLRSRMLHLLEYRHQAGAWGLTKQGQAGGGFRGWTKARSWKTLPPRDQKAEKLQEDFKAGKRRDINHILTHNCAVVCRMDCLGVRMGMRDVRGHYGSSDRGKWWNILQNWVRVGFKQVGGYRAPKSKCLHWTHWICDAFIDRNAGSYCLE